MVRYAPPGRQGMRCLPVYRPLAPLLLCLLAAGPLLGCGAIRYGTGDTHDRILQTSRRVVPGQGVRGKARQRGSQLAVQATRSCDLVEVHEIERTTVLEPEPEELFEEGVILGVGAVPLASGIILLADSGSVSGNDRNAREYNPVGPTGAIAGGVVLTALGTLLTTVPMVLIISSSVPDEERQIVHEHGRTLVDRVPCGDVADAAGIAVLGRFGPSARRHGVHQLHLGTTDDSGRALIDLAQVVPPAVLAAQIEPAVMQIWVEERQVAQVDLRAVRIEVEERQRRADQGAWRQARARRCRQLATPQACAGVRAYLHAFPEGLYAEDAAHLLERGVAAPVITKPEGPVEEAHPP